MRYLSNGDFIFPFNASFYWIKQIYIWSYQTGAANPDGIIRMPARLLDALVFALFGNIAIGYFYLFSSLAIVFASFYYFAHKFLGIKNARIKLLGALFFTLNPIFLGNLAKIGLILAVAMLPLCLTVIQEGFTRHRFRFFLLWIVFLNISLIHPFTFTVNLFASGCYFLYMAWQNRKFTLRAIPNFIVVGIAALLLNSYVILPIASIGSVSKDVLSSDVTSSPTNYTSLVAIANTGNIFTGLSLSKNVLKDFEFYNPTYANFYFLGVFMLYALLLYVYLRIEPRLNTTERRRIVVFMAAFLMLVLLATVTFLHMAALIKLLIGLPGGWMFRSPLKWQLYIPFALFTILTLLLGHVRSSTRRKFIYIGLACMFLLMNSFLIADIYKKLLRPRSVSYFSTLQNIDLDHKNLLVVNSDNCFSYAEDNPTVMTELNQVLISQNVQVKQIGIGDADTVNLSSYDYIIGCQDTMQSMLSKDYDFKLQKTFASNAFQLYANNASHPYVFTTPDLFALSHTSKLGDKNTFATQVLNKSFDFVDATKSDNQSTTSLQDVFDALSFKNLQGSTATTNVQLIHPGDHTLYIQNDNQTLYYTEQSNQILVSAVPQKGYATARSVAGTNEVSVNTEGNKQISFSYTDPAYHFQNIIPDASLERGLWQKKVGDCYAYDDQPEVYMSTSHDASDGKSSLELSAKNHIACSGPSDISVKPRQHYLLSFDYKSIGGRFAGYYVGYNDANGTSIGAHLQDTEGKWQTFSEDLVVPEGATKLHLSLYAYPDGSGIDAGTARYDNFHLTAVPNIQGRFYFVSNPKTPLAAPKKTEYKVLNPTKASLHVHGATTPFYLTSKETYAPQWQLELEGKDADAWSPLSHAPLISNKNHLKINSSMNGWYINPMQICAQTSSACTKNADGSFDINLVMEFLPQRWFYLGSLISGGSLVVAGLYFIYDARHDRIQRRYWRWRKK